LTFSHLDNEARDENHQQQRDQSRPAAESANRFRDRHMSRDLRLWLARAGIKRPDLHGTRGAEPANR
jgi:hypothetical protein